MFALLPDFTPRDSHSLWYSSPRAPAQLPHSHDPTQDGSNTNHHGQPLHHARQRAMAMERSALSQLAADEVYMRHRKSNISNFGSGWLKPPGIPKTLHQMREEKREQEEHQEAMRREQVAQELAEAEAGGMDAEGMMDDVQLDGAQDLDDEIPDAADEYAISDDDDEDSDDSEDADLDSEEEEEDEDEEAIREERQNDLIAARMRMTDDAFREAIVRGDPEGDDMYGGEEELEEEDQGHMLDEEDFGLLDDDGDMGGGDMDADLDDDIPEAESGGYEHTDSEAELSSSEEEHDEEEDEEDEDEDIGEIGFMPRADPIRPPQSPTMGKLRPSQNSMELSGLLSQDESSFMDSSPAQGVRARQP